MKNKLNVILLFGDGYIYGSGEPSPETILSAISSATHSGDAVVFTFGIAWFDEGNLIDIAEAGRGDYYFVSDPSKFGSIYNEVKRKTQEAIY